MGDAYVNIVLKESKKTNYVENVLKYIQQRKKFFDSNSYEDSIVSVLKREKPTKVS